MGAVNFLNYFNVVYKVLSIKGNIKWLWHVEVVRYTWLFIKSVKLQSGVAGRTDEKSVKYFLGIRRYIYWNSKRVFFLCFSANPVKNIFQIFFPKGFFCLRFSLSYFSSWFMWWFYLIGLLFTAWNFDGKK